jgi:hypothetical protein
MVYSHTQIAQYLACPRRYRYRYLEGWREKDRRASLLFGRVFEMALGSYFRRQDPAEVLFKEWAAYREAQLDYGQHDNWDRMVQQGVQLLNRFAQDDRVRIRQPRRNLQIKFTRKLANGNDFVAYVDAIGQLDGTRCLIDWKTTSSCYPEGPEGLLTLDPQLICYSWISGIADVALVVFVRKKFPEIQYLRTTISDNQRAEYGQLVEETVARIGAGHFLAHSGIRFPQNGCTSCPCLGLCLGNQDLVDSRLLRRPGASDLDWLDQLDY